MRGISQLLLWRKRSGSSALAGGGNSGLCLYCSLEAPQAVGGRGYTSVSVCLSGGGRPRTSALLCPLFLVGELGSSADMQAFRQIC